MITHADKTARLGAQIAAAGGVAAAGLAKRTSNLFRDRPPRRPPGVDLASFDDVIRIDAATGVVEITTTSGGVIMLDAAEVHKATPRILERYRIPRDRSPNLM